jgi:probable HAF family extracellular repeat protein
MRAASLGLLAALTSPGVGAAPAAADLIAVPESFGDAGYIALRGVSADGESVLGDEYFDGGGTPFRWTRSGGSQRIFAQGDAAAGALAADGSLAFGGGAHPWSATGTLAVPLPALVPEEPGFAHDVTPDASRIVGSSYAGSTDSEAVVWTAAGIEPIGFLAGDTRSAATAVSADGSRIAGWSSGAAGGQAVLWDAGSGPLGLGDLAGGAFGSAASGISADGGVVVGTGTSASGQEAFRWTEPGGMVGLGDLDGGLFFSEAAAVSADGAWIVGSGYTATGREAFVWDALGGMRRLEDFLRDEWALVFDDDWTFTAANAISDDGRVIVGSALDPDGVQVGFVATIPEPASLALVAASLAALSARRRYVSTRSPRRSTGY